SPDPASLALRRGAAARQRPRQSSASGTRQSPGPCRRADRRQLRRLSLRAPRLAAPHCLPARGAPGSRHALAGHDLAALRRRHRPGAGRDGGRARGRHRAIHRLSHRRGRYGGLHPRRRRCHSVHGRLHQHAHRGRRRLSSRGGRVAGNLHARVARGRIPQDARRRGLVPGAASDAADARDLPRRPVRDRAAQQEPARGAGRRRQRPSARAVRNAMSRSTHTLRSVKELQAAGLAAADEAGTLDAVAARYAVAVTPQMLRLIDPVDANDPVARQLLPDARELDSRPEERADPLDDARLSPVPGIVHRYPDRALLMLTHVCPVYCRFCFRREVVGPGGPQALSGKALDAALAYIAATPAIWEVILTGGDPFMLSPRRVAEVTRRLSAIAHVKVLRWHTRVPVADPARVSADLIGALKEGGKAVYVAIHANHPRELDETARAACARL